MIIMMTMIITSPPKVIWEDLHRHPSWQRMDSLAACTSYAMPTADKFSHSATGTLHPHHTYEQMTMSYTMLAQCCAVEIHQIQIWPTYTAKSQQYVLSPRWHKVICEELCIHPHMQRMDSPILCATICAIPTADETCHSVRGTTYPHHSATATYCLAYLLQICCNAYFFPEITVIFQQISRKCQPRSCNKAYFKNHI